MADGAPRKRKWDMPAPVSAAAPPVAAAPPLAGAAALPLAEAQARAQAAALAFAQRLGVPPGVPAPPAPVESEDVSAELDLNSLAPLARGALTKRPLHDDVTRRTGCVIHTRGRYAPPGAPPSGEKPLHLHVTPGAALAGEGVERRREAVQQAVAMLREATAPRPRGGAPAAAWPLPPQAPLLGVASPATAADAFLAELSGGGGGAAVAAPLPPTAPYAPPPQQPGFYAPHAPPHLQFAPPPAYGAGYAAAPPYGATPHAAYGAPPHPMPPPGLSPQFVPRPPPGPPPPSAARPQSYGAVPPPPSVTAGVHIVVGADAAQAQHDAAPMPMPQPPPPPQQQQQWLPPVPPPPPPPPRRQFREFKEASPTADVAQAPVAGPQLPTDAERAAAAATLPEPQPSAGLSALAATYAGLDA